MKCLKKFITKGNLIRYNSTFFHSERWKGANKLKVWRQPMTSQKRFQNDWNWHNALWHHYCLEHCCINISALISVSSLGKVLDLNTKLILLGKWPMHSPAVTWAIFTCFSLLFSNCELATFQLGKLKIVGTTSFLSTSWQSLKEGPNKTPYPKTLF